MVFIHGRGGRFEDFDALARRPSAGGRAYAYSWATGRLVDWKALSFAEDSARSRRACIGASVRLAARRLVRELKGLGGATVVGHSKGGAVVLQTLADIAGGAANPGIRQAVALDPAISVAAHLGIRLEAATKRWCERMGRAPVLGRPMALYARWFLQHDQLDIHGLRRRIGSIRHAGVPLVNVRARSRWSSHIPGARNLVFDEGGHRAVLDWPRVADLLNPVPHS